MAFADDLTAVRDNLLAELKGETARRAALVAAGNPPPATYTVAGKTVSWNEYMTMMLTQIKEVNEAALAAGGDGGLFEEHMRLYS